MDKDDITEQRKQWHQQADIANALQRHESFIAGRTYHEQEEEPEQDRNTLIPGTVYDTEYKPYW